MPSSISPLVTFPSPPLSVSKQTVHAAGFQTSVFGLDEIPPDTSEVACLWLLHPRLDTQEDMDGVATTVIEDWNQRLQNRRSGTGPNTKGLIAVSFDQRNHGTREVNPLANQAWRNGNPYHAQDMFSLFRGTAQDVSSLIDFLECMIFPLAQRSITDHYVLGISLGGHATWSCLFNEPRITAGVVIVGGPDYLNLMADRARLSKRPSWTDSDPPGRDFLGSKDFPRSLLAAVRRYDPAAMLLSHTQIPAKDAAFKDGPLPDPSEEDKERLRPILTQRLGGKRILQISGGSDKLVPYRVFEPILTWLKKAFAPGGWFADGGVHFEDLIFETATHQFTPAMMDEVLRFLAETMTASDSTATKVGLVREAKM